MNPVIFNYSRCLEDKVNINLDCANIIVVNIVILFVILISSFINKKEAKGIQIIMTLILLFFNLLYMGLDQLA